MPLAGTSAAGGDPKVLVILRFVFLAVALGATAMLVASHFNLLKPPGCGAGGGCDKAAESAFGKVPGMNWPVSFMGFAFYLAMMVALVATKGVVTGAMRHMTRLGALVSAFYIFIIILHRSEYLCVYCITSHLANFAFLATIELARPVASSSAMAAVLSLRTFVAAAVGFVVSTAGLAAGEAVAKQQSQTRADASADEIIKRSQQNQQPQQTQQTAPTAATQQPPAPLPKPATNGTVDGELWESRAARLGLPVNIPETVTPQGFTGRWRIGPEDAPIRIVAFSDYQCPDCRRVEDELKQLVMTRDDVSFSHKHFPFNMECNPTFKSRRSPHPNACWAARAAETAGILRGNRGFWEMHFWLYDRKDASGKPVQGSFTDPELVQGLTEMGYDPVQFQEIMKSAAAGDFIDDECLEGADLGLMFTPLIYINGVEFRQWNVPGAIKRAVERVAASNPPRGLPTLDQPAKAVEKAVNDWREAFVWSPESLAREGFSMASGPENSPLHIIYWGGYEDASSREMNKVIMDTYRGVKGVSLDFRHYPFHEDCNMYAEREDHTRGCRMASIAEGAGRVGGPEKFWQMHEWLMEQGANYTDAAMTEFAKSIGLDPAEVIKQAESREVADTIQSDCGMLQKKLSGRFVPAVVVNWRLCPRWKLNDGRVVLNDVLKAANEEVGVKN